MLGAFNCLRHDLKRRRTTECRRQRYFQVWQDEAAGIPGKAIEGTRGNW
jgi:hypothetical protein